MTLELSPNSYLLLLEARLAGCRSLMPGDTLLPRVREGKGETWLVKRSGIYGAPGLFENEPDAHRSFELARGGQLDLFLKIRKKKDGVAEVASYRIAVRGLPPTNDNQMESLRYDKSQGRPRDWDDELGDNPQHPWAHLHLNFHVSRAANDLLRLPTDEVDPIVLLVSFDHWYCNTYRV